MAHVPSCPGSAQDLHDPVQAVAQHRPWAHCPLVHWVPALQVAPLGRFPQVPATQRLPVVHWASLPQLLAHTLPLQPRWGAQLRAAGALQAPFWQRPAGVSVLAVASQRAPWQTVPLGYFWHAPMPLHLPLSPHMAAPRSRHIPLGSVALAGAGLH